MNDVRFFRKRDICVEMISLGMPFMRKIPIFRMRAVKIRNERIREIVDQSIRFLLRQVGKSQVDFVEPVILKPEIHKAIPCFVNSKIKTYIEEVLVPLEGYAQCTAEIVPLYGGLDFVVRIAPLQMKRQGDMVVVNALLQRK